MNPVLVRWFLAHEAVEENAGLLLKYGGSKSIQDMCVARMNEVAIADEELFNEKVANLPEIATKFIIASYNRGCATCNISSKKQHPGCEEKINNYFKLKEALMDYCANEVY